MMEKIHDLDAALEIIERARSQGKTVVFTNGCFDILHAGHVQYLEQARGLGDLLVVGINADSSVRGIKGPKRPIQALEDRAFALAGLACVDLVVPFEETDPFRLIEAISPDVLVKGEDWPEEAIVGAEFVRKRGGRVERIPLRLGVSTSRIIQRILENFRDPNPPTGPGPRECSRS